MNSKSALEICAIGLGQGGGNLAAEWHRRGHRALLINTARADARSLSRHENLAIADDDLIFIGQEGAEGAGRDPAYGAQCIEFAAEKIRTTVAARMEGADALLLCGGLGGGTGSAIATLAQVLEPLDIPLLTIATLPSEAESGIAKVNAVRATDGLIRASLNGRIFIDNERLVEAFPDLDVVTYYPHVNASVFGPLDEMIRINRREDLWSIRSFDGEDLRKVLLSGGVLTTHVETIDGELNAKSLVEIVDRCVDGGAHLAPGATIAEIAYLAMVITGPESALRKLSFRDFDHAMGMIKDESGGAAVYEGVYVGDDDEPLRAHVVAATYALPERIIALLERAQHEGRSLAEKIRDKVPGLAVDSLDELQLFRAPERRGSLPPMPASPKPRSLAAQLAQKPVRKSNTKKRERTRVTRDSLLSQSGLAEAVPSKEYESPFDEAGAFLSADVRFDDGRTEIIRERTPQRLQSHSRARIHVKADDADQVAEQADFDDGAADEMTSEGTLDELTLGSLAQRHPVIHNEVERTEQTKGDTSSEAPAWLRTLSPDSELASVIQNATDVHRLYEDLLERFRQTPDRRARERVARRLIDDARADDVEIRALAVWAMVKLKDRGFRRALTLASKDRNHEIKRLANKGLENMGATRPSMKRRKN